MKGKSPHFIVLLLGITSIFLFSLSGCSQEEDIPLETIDLQLDFQRFDLAQWKVANALRNDPNADKEALYTEHLLPHKDFIIQWLYQGQDSIINDSIIQSDLIDFFLSDPNVGALMDSVLHVFPENYPFEARLEKPLKRFKYHFPNKPLPKFRTFVTGYSPSANQGIDQIQVDGGYFGFGLHYFLGKEFPFYPPDAPDYIRMRMDPEFLEVMMFRDFTRKMLPDIPVWDNPRLIDRMVRSGIRLYVLDELLPQTPDSLKIFYNQEQMYWSTYWEGRIYAELLPNLYSTDYNIQEEYLGESPFTRKLSRESAPRIGEFCGWMIVRNYMEKNPDLSLDELIRMEDYDQLVKESGYRPEIPEGI